MRQINLSPEVANWKNSPERARLKHVQELSVWPYILDYFRHSREIRVKMGAFPNNHLEWKRLMDIRDKHSDDWFKAEMVRDSPQWGKWMELETRLQQWESNQRQLNEQKARESSLRAIEDFRIRNTPSYIRKRRLKEAWAICVLALLTGLVLYVAYLITKIEDTVLMCLFLLFWLGFSYQIGRTIHYHSSKHGVYRKPLEVLGNMSLMVLMLVATLAVLAVMGGILYFLGVVFWVSGGFLMEIEPVIGFFCGVCGVVAIGGIIAILFGWDPKC